MKIKMFGAAVILAAFFCLLVTPAAKAVNYTLTVGAQGSGSVTKNPNNGTFPSGVTVTVTATPNTGWYFANWSGNTNGSANPLNVTMNANLVITGNFLAFPTYALTLVTNGQGTIALNPAGGSYLSNSIVTATAAPVAGWVFTGWSGATNTSLSSLSLTLNTNVSLTGNFAQLPAFDLQPVSVTNTVGSTVNFSGHSVGTAPVSYQWFFSGGSLSNATNPTLTLTNITLNQTGNYWLVATNNYGSATSSVVKLVLTNGSGSTNVVSSPDEASLRAAIQIGGWVSLAFNGTLTLTNTIVITNNVILDASGVSAIISGGNAVRLFNIAPGAGLSATNLILANGCYTVTNTPADAGAIYNYGGNITLVGCLVTNNAAQSLIYSNGLARGGAIFNDSGNMYLIRSSFFNNKVVGGLSSNAFIDYPSIHPAAGLGGAIFTTNGSIILADCIVNNNTCSSAASAYNSSASYGGALFQSSGSLTIAGSLFATNLALGGDGMILSFSANSPSPAYGGAIASVSGIVVVDRSQFIQNTAQGGSNGQGSSQAFGGAIYNAAVIDIANTTFSGNKAISGINNLATGSLSVYGGAIYNLGIATLNSCSVYYNYVQGGSTANHAAAAWNGGDGFGGAIFNTSQIAATNCTIALNSAISGSGSTAGIGPAGKNGNAIGGGVFNNPGAIFAALNLTIASNSCVAQGAGFVGSNGIAAGTQIANTNGTLRLRNSAIASTNFNAYGTITDDGYNICSDGTANLFGGTSFNFTDPKLGSLANYGGPTLCMSLLPDSPAIDYADNLNFPSIDQRGYFRPIGDGPDVGAFEYGSHLVVIPYLSITSTGGTLTLSFTASPLTVYVLQSSANFTSWANLNTNGPFASSTNINQTISIQGLDARFFRLLAQ